MNKNLTSPNLASNLIFIQKPDDTATSGKMSPWYVDIFKWKIASFYRKRIKKYKVIRAIVLAIYKSALAVYINFIKKSHKYELIRQVKHTHRVGVRVDIAPAYTANNPRPLIFPASAAETLKIKESYAYIAPSIYVSTLENLTIFGNTDMVINNKYIIHHDSIDFRKYVSFEEYRLYAKFCSRYRSVKWFLPTDAVANIPEVAAFTDSASANFAHWLSEVLPKIVLFCDCPDFKSIPLVLNSNLPASILESACIAAGPERSIYILPPGCPLKIERLHLTSTAGYAPAEARGRRDSNFVEGNFNGHALTRMSQTLRAAAVGIPPRGERLYLRRQSSIRTLVNNDEIEKMLQKQGFSSIDTGRMSLLEQVSAMAGARWIVAPGGASLANLMFCPPGTTIIVLAARNPDISYFYWQNMARPFGVNVRFVLSRTAYRHIHTDFEIDPGLLLDALEAP